MESEEQDLSKLKKDDLGLKNSSTQGFDKLEEEFQTVLNALEGDAALHMFRIEHEKLFQALKKSYHQERFLAKRCEDLSREITNNATKVQDVIQSSRQYQSSINLLKQDSEKAWALVETGRKKELTLSSTIEALQEEIKNFSDKLQEERVSSLKSDELLTQLTRDRDEMNILHKQALADIESLERKNDDISHHESTLEKQVVELKMENSSMAEDLEKKNKKLNNLVEQLNEAKALINDLYKQLEEKCKENKSIKASESVLEKELDKMTLNLNTTKSKLEHRDKEVEDLVEKTLKLSTVLESQKDQMLYISKDLQKNRDELKISLSVQNKLVLDNKTIQKKYDKEHKIVLKLQQSVEHIKTESSRYQKEINVLQQTNEEILQREEKSIRQIIVLEREKNLQIEKLQRIEKKLNEAEVSALQQEQTILSLEKEVSSLNQTNSNITQNITSLEKANEKLTNELVHERSATIQERDTILSRDRVIQDLERVIESLRNKVLNESNVSKQLRKERDKALCDIKSAKEEIINQKNLLRTSENEIKFLQNEMGVRDTQITKENFERKQETVKKDQVSNELSRVKEYTMSQDALIRKQELDIKSLRSTLKKADDQALEQRKEYDHVIHERDILTAQLIRRNDELAILDEKVKSQDITIATCEMQYSERINDIRLLTIKVQDLQRELNLKTHARKDDDLTALVAQKDKELTQERIKVKALSDELENPINVHRWRKLEGSDPAVFELIQKIDILQKRLIKKTEAVFEKDAIIHTKTQEFEQLKKILNMQPGTEVAEKLSLKENEVREKGRQMKAMAGELNMHQMQISEYRSEVERLQNELHDLKSKFYDVKKKEAFFKERELQIMTEAGLLRLEDTCCHESHSAHIHASHRQVNEIQFVGGGFRFGPPI